MKLRPKLNSIQQQTSEEYIHPWYEYYNNRLIKPNPPSKEAIERAKFKDRTYVWSRDNSVRPRNRRAA